MRSRTSHLFVFGLFAAALLILSLNAWLALSSIQDLSRSYYWVDHSWRVIFELQQVSDSLNNAGTATQEYLLSGNPENLQPYEEAIRALPGELGSVAMLIVDNPNQQRVLKQLRNEIESDRAMLGSRISQGAASHRPAAGGALLSAADLAQIRHGRSVVARMQQTERGLLSARVAIANRSGLRTKEAAIFASAVDLLFLLLLFRGFTSERRLREEGERTTDRLRKLESVSDVSLTRLSVHHLNEELLGRLLGLISADSVLLLVEQQGAMKVEASSGTNLAQGANIPLAEGDPLHRALQKRTIITVHGTAANFLPFEAFHQPIGSLLIAPLPAFTSVSGLVVAGRQKAHPFESNDREILSVAADRIGMALDRANVSESEQQARRQAETSAEEVRQLNADLEARVSQRTAELEASNRELEAFSYSVSHDLRAPLRTIDGFSLALEEDYRDSLDANARDYLHRIRDGVQRMGSLIDSLLHLSRITRAELVREPVNLSALAQSVAGELAQQNPDRKLVFDIQPGLECTGDPRLLRVALENLMGNAVKFTARQGEARVEFGRSGDAYFVRDNGVGFNARYTHKLFRAFNRLHGDNEFRGSGIGLATVARIIQRHQGKVWAESAEGRGATFWFQLG